jgi:glycosyltransferase involved in cell wall biosynthesis
MACGRAVVVTDTDGARESLPAGHETSCLVPREEPGALARALTHLLADPPLRASLGAEGREHAAATHDVRHTTDAVATLYRELLGRSGAGVPRADRRERITR